MEGDNKKKGGDEGSKNSIQEIREAFKNIKEISDLLGTGLDAEVLALCIRLIEDGVDPEALARVVVTMKKEAERVDNSSK